MNPNHTEPPAKPVEKWWVAIHGQPEGPHTPSYLAFLFNAGDLGIDAKVCQVGHQAWTPLREAKELLAAADFQLPERLPPQLPAPEEWSNRQPQDWLRKFTNPALPWFANWICVYCLILAPATLAIDLFLKVLGINSAADLRTETPIWGHAVAMDVSILLVDVAVASLLIVGGVQLRNQQRQGIWLLKIGFVLSLCWGMVSLLVSILWDALVTLAYQPQPTDELSAGQAFLFLLLVLLGLSLFIFEIAALVWLIKNEDRLPLKDSGRTTPSELGELPTAADPS